MPKVIGTPNVRFNLSNVRPSSATVNVFFRYGGKRLVYAAELKINPKNWNRQLQRVNRKEPDHLAVNQYLNELEQLTKAVYNDLGDVPTKDFRDEIEYRLGRRQRPDGTPETLTVHAGKYIERLEGSSDIVRSTVTPFKVTLTHLTNYEKKEGVNARFDALDKSFFEGFKQYLFDPPVSQSISTVKKHLQRVRQMVEDANDRYGLTIIAHKRVTTKTVKTDKGFALTPYELEAIQTLDLSDEPRLDKVRDIFIIGAYTGQRWATFSRIRKEHIHPTEDGTGYVIRISNKKVKGKSVVVPVEEPLLRVLEKYEFEPPTISSQKFNKYLKEIAERAGVTADVLYNDTSGGEVREARARKCDIIGSHCCRRTYATIRYRAGIPASVLMQITQHATESQFLEYIKVTKEESAEALRDQLKRVNLTSPLRRVN